MLSQTEIRVGAIAYFEQSVLHNSPELSPPEAVRGDTTKLRPFVCVEVEGSRSKWTGLTTTRTQFAYVNLGPRHVLRGYGPMADGTCYIHGSTYEGPSHVFVTASANERVFVGGRPQVTAEGMVLVRLALENRAQAVARLAGRQQMSMPVAFDPEDQWAIYLPEYSAYGYFDTRSVTPMSNPIRATLWGRRSDAERRVSTMLRDGIFLRGPNIPFFKGPVELHRLLVSAQVAGRETFDINPEDAP
jgi:hypothetical protein